MAPQDLAGALQGTWVRELTWYGIAVDNESALYFQFSGTDFTAMMYDQSNMALGPMRQRLQTIRTSPELMAKTATMTFIDCDYYIVDKYYKISDQNVIEPASFRSSGFQIEALNLPKDVHDVAGDPGSGLRNVWNALQRGGFFDQDFRSRAHVALLAGGQLLNEVTSPPRSAALWKGSLKFTTSPISRESACRWAANTPVRMLAPGKASAFVLPGAKSHHQRGRQLRVDGAADRRDGGHCRPNQRRLAHGLREVLRPS